MRTKKQLARIAFSSAWLVVTGCAAPVRPRDSAASPLRSADGCHAEEASRGVLRVDEHAIAYVEPLALAANDAGDLFLAGRYAAIFDSTAAGWRARPRSPTLGAIIASGRYARLVPSPLGSQLAVVRVAPGPDGQWWIAFASDADSVESQQRSHARDLFFGIFDRTWRTIDTLPNPSNVLTMASLASELVIVRDTAYWALTPTNGRTALLYRRVADRWSVETVKRFNARTILQYRVGRGLIAGLVTDDGTPAAGGNSLFLSEPFPTAPLQLAIPGRLEAVEQPTLLARDSVDVLSWITSGALEDRRLPRLRAIRGNVGAGLANATTLDSAVVLPASLPILNTVAGPIWVVEHAPASRKSELRIVGLRKNGQPILLSQAVLPFEHALIAAARRPDEIIVSGLYVPPSRAVVASLQLRFQLHCLRQ